MRDLLFFIFALSILTACETTVRSADTVGENLKMWVNGQKVECTGVAPMECLQIQYGETVNPDGWQYFYDDIEGFEFEEGYLFQLDVEKSERPLQDGQIPADAGKYQYKLIEMISKTKS
jgi:hypothetical protein